MLDPFALLVLGFVAAVLGTLVGAGGGFVMVPTLALLRGDLPASALSAMSLAAVALNGASGALAYARSGRIDYRSAIPFALAALPGSVLGALLTRLVDRRLFDAAFGLFLVAIAVFLAVRTDHALQPRTDGRGEPRELIDRRGNHYVWRVDVRRGIVLSLGIGVLSSLFGIGGGIVHVPALIALLGFPAHVATATSQLVLAIVSTSGTATHLASGHLEDLLMPTLYLAMGAVVGAQLGARLSERVSARVIVRVLAVGLVAAGIRLAWQALTR